MFTLLNRLLHPAPAAGPAHGPVHPMPQPARQPGPTEPGDGAERVLGCGWFDSSHDLLSGISLWEGIIVVDNTVASSP